MDRYIGDAACAVRQPSCFCSDSLCAGWRKVRGEIRNLTGRCAPGFGFLWRSGIALMSNICMINAFPASEALQKDPVEVMPVQTSIKRPERPDSWGGQELVRMNSHDSAEIGSAAFCELRIWSSEFRGTARVALPRGGGHWSEHSHRAHLFLSKVGTWRLAAVLVPSSRWFKPCLG